MTNDEDVSPQQERADVWRTAYRKHDLQGLIRNMASARTRKEQAEETLKDINAEYDVLRLELIPTKMEEEGIERITVAGIGRVSLTGDMYVRVTDTSSFLEWLRLNNLYDLVKESVPSSTLKAFIKERVKAAKELPESVDVKPFTRASITKG